jgi:hypothetical protein
MLNTTNVDIGTLGDKELGDLGLAHVRSVVQGSTATANVGVEVGALDNDQEPKSNAVAKVK